MKMLITGAFPCTDEQSAALTKQGFELSFVADELTPLDIDCSEFDAVVCNSLFLHTPAERFTSLKAVQLTSAGFDRVPAAYFESRGVALFNARGVYSVPMAEWVVLKALEFYKDSGFFRDNQKAKLWCKNRRLREISGKTVLIIGTGSVGTECAKRFCTFGAHVIGADIFDSGSEYYEHIYYMDSLKQALALSDIVVLTLPLNAQTEGLFDAELFSAMKDDSVFINVSRGKVVNEAALTAALAEGKFSGVALDVFGTEPLPQDSPLWETDRVSVTPHNSFVSDMNSSRLFNLIYKNLTEFDYGRN